MAIKLTKKQLLVLDFLREFMSTHDYSPSYREIMAALNLGSVSTVAEHIDNLVAAGVLKKVSGTARSLELIDYQHLETVNLFKARLETATDEEKQTLLKAAELLDIDIAQ